MSTRGATKIAFLLRECDWLCSAWCYVSRSGPEEVGCSALGDHSFVIKLGSAESIGGVWVDWPLQVDHNSQVRTDARTVEQNGM